MFVDVTLNTALNALLNLFQVTSILSSLRMSSQVIPAQSEPGGLTVQDENIRKQDHKPRLRIGSCAKLFANTSQTTPKVKKTRQKKKSSLY